jgi:hypothetical protein
MPGAEGRKKERRYLELAAMPDRFFLTPILGGRLQLDGIPEWGPWEASRLHWWPEDHLDLVLTTTAERKVRTTEELEAAIKEPVMVRWHDLRHQFMSFMIAAGKNPNRRRETAGTPVRPIKHT